MKLKHWQGYGTVDAIKVKKTTKVANNPCSPYYGCKLLYLTIKVSGNHECGLEKNVEYDVFHWLVKRFAKEVESWTNIVRLETDDFYEDDKEICVYHITCKL